MSYNDYSNLASKETPYDLTSGLASKKTNTYKSNDDNDYVIYRFRPTSKYTGLVLCLMIIILTIIIYKYLN